MYSSSFISPMYPIRKHNASTFVSNFASSDFSYCDNNLAMENRLKILRKEAQLSLDKLGELVGSTRSTIQKLETGKMEMTVTWMRRLGKALKKDPIELITSAAPNKNIVTIEEKLFTNCFLAMRAAQKEMGRELSLENEIKLVLELYNTVKDRKAKGEDVAPSTILATFMIKQNNING